jgi:hypothetical protein
MNFGPDLGEGPQLPELEPDFRKMQQGQPEPEITIDQPKIRSVRSSTRDITTSNGSKRRPVKDRWYYEPVFPSGPLLATIMEPKVQVGGEESIGAIEGYNEGELN